MRKRKKLFENVSDPWLSIKAILHVNDTVQQTLLAPGFSFDPLRGKCLDLWAKVQADKTPEDNHVCSVAGKRDNAQSHSVEDDVIDEGAADTLKKFKADELSLRWRESKITPAKVRKTEVIASNHTHHPSARTSAEHKILWNFVLSFSLC